MKISGLRFQVSGLVLALASCLLPLALLGQSPISDLNVQRTARFGSHSTGTITPAQITADQNNYAPTGYAAAFRMRLSSDAARSLTGLAAGAGGGGTIVLVNVGSFPITLEDEHASSTAANRFALSGDYLLAADTSAFLEYDATATRWRLIGTTSASIAGSFQPLDATLTALAGVTTAADKLVYATGSDTFSTTDFTAYGRSLVGVANEAAFKALVNLEIGTDVQAQDAELAAIAGLTSAADKLPYFTGSGTAAVADFTAGGRALVNSAGTADTFPYFSASNTVTLGSITAAGRALLDDASASAQRTTLGLDTDDAVTFGAISGTTGAFSGSLSSNLSTSAQLGIKGGSSGLTVSYFVANDTTTTTMAHWERSDGAVAAKLIYDGTGLMRFGTSTAHNLELMRGGTTVATFDSSGGNGVWGATTPAAGSFTTLAGTTITGSFALQSTGALQSYGASKVTLSHESANASQLNSFGQDTSNYGTLTIYSRKSDGTAGASSAFSSTGLAVTGDITAISAVNTGTAAFKAAFVGSTHFGISLTDSSDTSGAAFAGFKKSNGTTIGSISRVNTTDAVSYITTSDENFKRDFQDVDPAEIVAAVEAARIVLFNWRADGTPDLGVTAQQLAASHPLWLRIRAVTPGSDRPGYDYATDQARLDRRLARRRAYEVAKAEHAAEVKRRTAERDAAESARKKRLGRAKWRLLEEQAALLAPAPSAVPDEFGEVPSARPIEAVPVARLQALQAAIAKIPVEDRSPAALQLPAEPVLERAAEDDLPDYQPWTVNADKVTWVLLAYAQIKTREQSQIAARVAALEAQKPVAQVFDWTTAAALVATGYLLRRRFAA